MWIRRQSLVLVVCVLLQSSPVRGQSRNEFGIWLGVSAGTPTLIGKSERVSLAAFGLRYKRTLLDHPSFKFSYALEAVPLARLSYLNEANGMERVRGRGMSPIGFDLGFRPGQRLEPAISVGGGLMHFERNVPSLGRRLNFTGDAGASVRIRMNSTAGAFLAYRYFHVSNAYSAPSNPGFDANLFAFGMELRR